MTKTEQNDRLRMATMFFRDQTGLSTLQDLSWLLFYLDMEHFTETGRLVTGSSYHAAAEGPLPMSTETIDEVLMDSARLSPVQYDHSVFSSRQLRIMKRVAQEHVSGSTLPISQSSRLPKNPWKMTPRLSGEQSQRSPIDPMLALENSVILSKEDVREIQDQDRIMERFFIGD